MAQNITKVSKIAKKLEENAINFYEFIKEKPGKTTSLYFAFVEIIFFN